MITRRLTPLRGFPFVLLLSAPIACSSPGGDAHATGGTTTTTSGAGGGGGGSPGAGGAGGAASPSDAGTAGDGATAPSCAKLLGSGATSAWAHADAAGKLVYEPLDSKGDHIMDFSSAGYAGGGVAIPVAPVKKTVPPSGKDDTAAIQAAINAVSALTPVNGLRGAVLLEAGTFQLAGSLSIGASGVVLRGSGSGAKGTIVQVTGTSRTALTVQGTGDRAADGTAEASITDAYVPSGASSFTVNSATGFAVGDSVLVNRPVTAKWVTFMDMDQLYRDGKHQNWIKAGSLQSWERTITAIEGEKVTLDIPLSDSLDAEYVSPPGATMTKYTYPGRISQVGVESLRFECPPRSATLAFDLIDIDVVSDAWIQDIAANNFTDGVQTGDNAKRLTLANVVLTHDADSYFTDWGPFDFGVRGTQTLVVRSSSTGGNKIWYYATHEARGPNVVLDFAGTGINSHLAGHERWGTGLLVDRATVTGGIDFTNLGIEGSGHGWTLGWSVAWNCVSDTDMEQPPGSMNWAIGCTGNVAAPSTATWLPGSPPIPAGTYASENKPVAPDSLYLAQLCERLGPAAVAAIGYP